MAVHRPILTAAGTREKCDRRAGFAPGVARRGFLAGLAAIAVLGVEAPSSAARTLVRRGPLSSSRIVRMVPQDTVVLSPLDAVFVRLRLDPAAAARVRTTLQNLHGGEPR